MQILHNYKKILVIPQDKANKNAESTLYNSVESAKKQDDSNTFYRLPRIDFIKSRNDKNR